MKEEEEFPSHYNASDSEDDVDNYGTDSRRSMVGSIYTDDRTSIDITKLDSHISSSNMSKMASPISIVELGLERFGTPDKLDSRTAHSNT